MMVCDQVADRVFVHGHCKSHVVMTLTFIPIF